MGRIIGFINALDKYLGITAVLSVFPSSSLAWAGVKIVLGAFSDPNTDLQHIIKKTIGEVGFREVDQAGRLRRAQKRAFKARLIFAISGGAAFIVPVLIMTLHPSTSTSLITLSVATFIFALLMAFFATDADGKDVLAATAAYVAVLVVFVGTSLPNTS
jgi:hypothetical protein